MCRVNFVKTQLVREKSANYDVSRKVSTPEDAMLYITQVTDIYSETVEVLYGLFLDNRNNVNCIQEIARGAIDMCAFDPKNLFRTAILSNTNQVIVLHNHPSGECEPSNEDIKMYKTLQTAGNLLGINVIDSIVIGHKKHTSIKSMIA